MGYDLVRFVGEIDEEFQCSICSMVFDNPVQTPCEHTFCNECVVTWISENATCPIDRKPLSQSELKTPGRLALNLLAKLKIRCSFDLQGCEVIVELVHLQDHLASCKYNPNSEVICDKGCNMKMRGHVYQTHNCLTYLVNLMSHQKQEIRNLTCELIKQHKKFQRVVNGQEEEIEKLKEVVSSEKGDNIELNNENRRLREEIAKLNNVVKVQQENIPNVVDNSTISLNETLKWRALKNVRFCKQTNILECKRCPGTAQSYYPLSPINSSFKVKILRVEGHIAFGLSTADNKNPSLYHHHSVYYHSDGVLFPFGKRSSDETRKWAVGDIIQCGIKFRQNMLENGTTEDTMYFEKNGELAYETVVQMRADHLFPTIALYGNNGDKVKILSNKFLFCNRFDI